MTVLITILHVIVCLMLIVVILVQGGRGQGLSGPSFSSGNVQSLFGTQAADFLTKATTVSAICFVVTCLALNFIEMRKSRSLLAGSQTAPVDIDAVRKALEKVKAEQAASAPSTSDAAKKEVASLVENVKAEAQTAETDAVSAVTAAADTLKAEAKQAVDTTAEKAASAVSAAAAEVKP